MCVISYFSIGILQAGGTFSIENFDDTESTYKSTEKTIDEMRRYKQIEAFIDSTKNCEYLYNDEKKTAVLLKCVIKKTRKLFHKKFVRTEKNPYDLGNRETTVSVARCMILSFLNHQKFHNYHLVVSIGSRDHESCIFFRNMDVGMEAIYFNPNYSEKHDGAQYSQIGYHLMTSFGNTIRRIRAYYSPSGNTSGKCSAITWERIFEHVCNGLSPFHDNNLQLEDYNHFTTTYSYRKYHRKIHAVNSSNRLKHHQLWENCDGMLINMDDNDVGEISKRISEVISGFYLQKSKSK